MRDVQGVFTLTTDQEERKHMNSTRGDSPRRSVETNLTAGTNHGQLHKLRAVRATGTVSTSAVTAQARAPLAGRICERRAAAGCCRQKTLNDRIEGAGRTREAEGVRGLRPTHMLNHHKHAPGGATIRGSPQGMQKGSADWQVWASSLRQVTHQTYQRSRWAYSPRGMPKLLL